MDPLRKTVIRLVAYGAVIGYMLGDLFLWHGFLRQKIDRADPNTPEAIAEAKAQGVVARVFNRNITRNQLDRAVAERLWREGKALADVPAANLRMVRYAALNELIDYELLRVKAKAHAADFIVDPKVLEARYQRFLSRFSSEIEMIAAARQQGIGSKQELRERIAAWIQQEQYVEAKIAPLTEISEEEMRGWWQDHQEELGQPLRVHARHVFVPTLDRDPQEVKQQMATALADLQREKLSFEKLAKSISEDPTTKDHGGDLGWISASRLPSDFINPILAMKPAKPTLLQTKIGWHIVEVIGRIEAKPRTWEESQEEVRGALLAIKRDQAVREYQNALRQYEGHKIQIFQDMVE